MPSLASIRFAAEEGASAATGPVDRAQGAFALADRLAAEAPAGAACAPGCTSCCHLYVTVTPSEAIAIAQHLPADPALRARIADNALRAAGLSVGQYRRARIRCALLDTDGRCSVYALRPLKCRAHTSRLRETCERVFAGDAPSSAIPTDPWLINAIGAVRAGLCEGSGTELHAALIALA